MIAPDRRRSIEFVLDNLVWVILAAVLIVFSLTIPNYFQIGIFANIIEQSTFVGTMAIGLSLVIIAGNIDLSVEFHPCACRHGHGAPVRHARRRTRHRIDA